MSDPKVDEIIRLHECMKQRDTRIERLEAALRLVRPKIETWTLHAEHAIYCQFARGYSMNTCNCPTGEKLRTIDAALAPQE